MGNQSKSITVESNDPENPKVVLTISATVEIEFGFETYSTNLGRVMKNDTVIDTVLVLFKDPESTTLDSLVTSSPFISAKEIGFVEEENGKKMLRVEVTLTPGFELGRLNETVTAYSNLTSSPKSDLRVTGSVVGDVEVLPDRLRFMIFAKDLESDSPIFQKFTIVNNSEKERLEVLQINDPRELLSVEVEELEPGAKYEVTASLKSREVPMPSTHQGKLVIKTNNEKQAEIDVPYTLFYRQ